MTNIYSVCPLGQVKERDNECYSPRCLVWMILIRELVPSLLHRTAQVLTQVKFQSVLVTTAAAAEESCGRYRHVPSSISGYRVDTEWISTEWIRTSAWMNEPHQQQRGCSSHKAFADPGDNAALPSSCQPAAVNSRGKNAQINLWYYLYSS